MISNPIFKREFIASARSWKTRFLVGAYLLMLSGLLMLLWPSGGVQSVVTESARQIFSMFFCVNLALLLLITPAFSASSITLEREQGTYNALFTTLLSPWDIMIGKLSAAVLMLLVLTLLAMPISAVCSLTGGVDTLFIFKVMLVLTLTAVSYGLIGLACSSICQRTTSAVIMNYVLILALCGGTWLPSALLSNLLPQFNFVWQLIRNISPFDAILFLLYPDSYKMTSVVEFSFDAVNPFNVFILASVVLGTLAFLIFCKNVLRPNTKSRMRKGEVYTESKKAIKRKLTFPFYLFDPLRRKKPVGRFQNPVFVAEMRSKLFSNPQFVLRTVSIIFIMSLVLLTLIAFQFGTALRSEMVKMVAIIFQVSVVALLAPGVSSGLITDEVTSGTFTALRMTTLSPVTVILGKLKATFFYAMIFIISSVFVLLAMAYLEQQELFPETSILDPSFWEQLWCSITQDSSWLPRFWETYWTLFAWIIILLLSTMTFLSGGLLASTLAKSTAIATAIAYAFTGILCIATLLPLAMEDKLSHSFSAFLLSFNPIVAAMQVTSHFLPEYPDLWVQNIYSLLGLNVIFLAGAMFRVWQLFRKQG